MAHQVLRCGPLLRQAQDEALSPVSRAILMLSLSRYEALSPVSRAILMLSLSPACAKPELRFGEGRKCEDRARTQRIDVIVVRED